MLGITHCSASPEGCEYAMTRLSVSSDQPGAQTVNVLPERISKITKLEELLKMRKYLPTTFLSASKKTNFF